MRGSVRHCRGPAAAELAQQIQRPPEMLAYELAKVRSLWPNGAVLHAGR